MARVGRHPHEADELVREGLQLPDFHDRLLPVECGSSCRHSHADRPARGPRRPEPPPSEPLPARRWLRGSAIGLKPMMRGPFPPVPSHRADRRRRGRSPAAARRARDWPHPAARSWQGRSRPAHRHSCGSGRALPRCRPRTGRSVRRARSASRPIAPVPANRSSTRAPSISSPSMPWARMLNTDSRTRSLVGRVAWPPGGAMLWPLNFPPTMRIVFLLEEFFADRGLHHAGAAPPRCRRAEVHPAGTARKRCG